MAFKGNPENLPRPEDVVRCAFGGSNNSKAKGGCGKPVEKLIQQYRSEKFGTTWFSKVEMDYCVDHKNLDLDYADKVSNIVKTKVI